MSKNFKSVVCCVLTLLLVAGTIVFAFAGNDGKNVVESETASEVESVVDSEVESVIDSEVTTEAASEDESEVTGTVALLGDLNTDGTVTTSDARTALRIAASLELGTDIQRKLADVNGDGEIKASDARLILRVAVGLDPMFSTIVL